MAISSGSPYAGHATPLSTVHQTLPATNGQREGTSTKVASTKVAGIMPNSDELASTNGKDAPREAADESKMVKDDVAQADVVKGRTHEHEETAIDGETLNSHNADAVMTNGRTNDHLEPELVAFSKTSIDTSETVGSDGNDSASAEFAGDVNTNNEIPTKAVLRTVADMTVLDKDGKIVAFKNLYSGPNVTRRVLIIFIRHFFCGNCQEYIRTLNESITPEELLTLPTPTFIAVVGHGSPSLIPMYATETRCPFPIYADPTKRLYNALGMLRTLNLGERPEYQRRGTVKGMWQSVRQGILNLKGGKALQGLDWHQVGGEFLFEPVNISTPIASPADEVNKQLDGPVHGIGKLGYAEATVEEKRITWCHRMKNTRDHAEIPELREVLGLDGVGVPGKDKKRWTRALGQRKGTGLSTRTSTSIPREGGRSARQSLDYSREKALNALNGGKTEDETDELMKEPAKVS